MINFPNTPTLAQIFTTAGSSWQWDGSKWEGATVAGGGPYLLLTGGALTGQLTVNPNIVIGNPVTSPPATSLVINKAASTPQTSTTPLIWAASEAGGNGVLIDIYSPSASANLTARKARGTAAAPTAVQAADTLSNIITTGYGASAYGNATTLAVKASENWSNTAQGSFFAFSTNTPGTTSIVQRATINQGVVIGNPAPDPGQGGLVLNANAAGPSATDLLPANLVVAAADGVNSQIIIDSFGTGNVPVLWLRQARGTGAAPTALQANDVIGAILGRGRAATNYGLGPRIDFRATQNWTDTAQGGATTFQTVPNGSVALAEAMRIDHNGNVGIGTTGPSGKLHVVNNDSNLILDTPTANQTASISFRDGGNARWGLFTSASASHDFGLYNSTTASVSLTVQSSSGNVGIGTTTPQFLLDVAGSAKSYNLTVGDLTAHDGYIGLYARSATAYAPGIDMSVTSAYAGFQISRDTSLTNFWAVKTINTGQNIGIFTDNNPANGIFVATGGRVAIGTTSLVTGVKLYASNTTAGWWAARFSSVSGAHGVIITAGATSTEYPLLIQDTTGVTNLCIIYGNGACYNISGSWGSLSDRQVKQDITLYERGLDAIVKLSPVYFRYAPNTPMGSGEKPSRRLFGLIADEVKPHIPEVVGTMVATVGKKEGVELSTLEPGNLIYALINAVKELNAKVEAMTPPPARRKAA